MAFGLLQFSYSNGQQVIDVVQYTRLYIHLQTLADGHQSNLGSKPERLPRIGT